MKLVLKHGALNSSHLITMMTERKDPDPYNKNPNGSGSKKPNMYLYGFGTPFYAENLSVQTFFR
jgi:hypothetical protein